MNVFLQEDFVKVLVENMNSRRLSRDEIIRTIRRKTWYGLKDYVISNAQLDKALEGKDVPPYQQSMADLILFYGKDIVNDINDVVLINVKSHDIDKESRPPNIVSAKRILEFIRDVLKERPHDVSKVNLWFIGIYYRRKGSYAKIVEVHVKDFFKLDVAKIPIINFDAAIQIQWHVKDMEERPDINKFKFVKSLAEEYLKRWEIFTKKRTENIKELINELMALIKKVENERSSHVL